MTGEHRQELRLGKDETVFIETYSAYPGNPENCRIVICHSVDVSANGLKAQVDARLPVNAIYQLCVEPSRNGKRIYLSGQVRWVVDAEDGRGYCIGIRIFESDDTDIEEWKRYIAAELAASRADNASPP